MSIFLFFFVLVALDRKVINMVNIEKEYEYVMAEQDIIVTKTDLKGVITFVNDEFLRVSKYTREKVIGKKHDIFRHPDMPKEVFDNLWQTILDECTWTGIVKNTTKDGGFYWVQADVTSLYEDNKLVGFMSVRRKPAVEDVKKAEIAYAQMHAGCFKGYLSYGQIAKRVCFQSIRYKFNNLQIANKLGLLIILSGAVILFLTASTHINLDELNENHLNVITQIQSYSNQVQEVHSNQLKALENENQSLKQQIAILSNKDYLAEKGALKKSEEERTLGDFFYQARTISNLELQSEQQKNLLISFIYLTLLILLCDFIIRSITDPLKEATSVLMQISSGNYRVSIKHRSKNEIGRMIEALRSTSVRLGFDIANDKKQADELRRVKVGLDNLTKGIVIANSARKIIYINPAAIEIFARVEDELRKIIPDFSVNNIIGKNIEFFHRNPTYSINLINGLTDTVPLEMYIGDQIITVNATPIMNASRQRIGSVAEFENITERENNRLQLVNTVDKNQLLNQQVNQMQKVESLSRLTSGIAHDFNNILCAIIGYNQLNRFSAEDCIDGKLKDEILFNTEQVNLASERAVRLIKKMMSYSRQNTANKEMEVKPTHEVIDEVLKMVRPALTSIFQLNAEVDSDLTVQIDSTELHQILTNLIVNARDAMKQGGIITVYLKKISTQDLICNACIQKLERKFIELSISDSGTGIEESILSHVFDPFFTTKPVGEGTGLGLSTVSGMMHEADGHIIIDSNTTMPNRGTTFRLLFPII